MSKLQLRMVVAGLAALALVGGIVAIVVTRSNSTPPKALQTPGTSTTGTTSVPGTTAPGGPAGLGPPPLPPHPTGATFGVPSSIAADCSTDVTAQLMHWINSVPDNSTLTFTPRACYEVEGTLFIENRNNLFFEGNGAKFWAKTDGIGTTPVGGAKKISNWPVGRAQWWIKQGTNISIDNVVVHGSANLGPEGVKSIHIVYIGQYGVEFSGVNGGLLENSTITDTISDLVGLTASDPGDTVHPQPCRNITIVKNHLEHADRDGPSVYDGENVLIDHNFISDTHGPIVDLEPVALRWLVNNAIVTNNTAGPHAHFFLTAAGSSLTNDNLDIENNIVTGGALDIVIGSRSAQPPIRHNVRIVNNRADTRSPNGTALIDIRGIDGVTISGNQALSPGIGVNIRLSTNVVVVNNTFRGASRPVVADSSSTVSQSNNAA